MKINSAAVSQNKWLILAAVACGTFMATLDSSIVNVALPSITDAFNTTLSHSRWVVISYLFSITGLLLFFGKLADVLGRKFIFNLGYLVFTVGSLFCALSTSIEQLILARGFQGFGAAMLMANGPAIITAAFPSTERGKALGTLAMVVSLGLAAGPTLGGFIVSHLGWPTVFYINIPLGFLGAYMVYIFVPVALGSHKEQSTFEREQRLNWKSRVRLSLNKLRYFDWLGTILWIIIQVGYSLAIDSENVMGLALPLQKLIVFSSIGLLILFLIWEWSVQEPVLNLSLFRSRTFLYSNISSFFSYLAISSIMLLLPFYLQTIRGFAPDQVGLFMTVIPLTIFFVAPVSGRLSDRHGARILSFLGMSSLCASLLLLSVRNGILSQFSSYGVVLCLSLAGIGIGLFQSPNNNAIMGAVAKNHLGVASALLATVRNFGMVSGAALSTTILMYFYHRKVSFLTRGAAIPFPEEFISSMQHTFLFLGLICLIGVFTSLSKEKHEHQNRHR